MTTFALLFFSVQNFGTETFSSKFWILNRKALKMFFNDSKTPSFCDRGSQHQMNHRLQKVFLPIKKQSKSCCLTLNFCFVSISFAQLLLVLAESLLVFSTQLAEQDQPMRDQHHQMALSAVIQDLKMRSEHCFQGHKCCH